MPENGAKLNQRLTRPFSDDLALEPHTRNQAPGIPGIALGIIALIPAPVRFDHFDYLIFESRIWILPNSLISANGFIDVIDHHLVTEILLVAEIVMNIRACRLEPISDIAKSETLIPISNEHCRGDVLDTVTHLCFGRHSY